jgi:hypothetical protein
MGVLGSDMVQDRANYNQPIFRGGSDTVVPCPEVHRICSERESYSKQSLGQRSKVVAPCQAAESALIVT